MPATEEIQPTVSLQMAQTYDLSDLRRNMAELLTPIGGMENFVKAGDRVLLKPNLVLGAGMEKAVNTHPAIVRVIGEMVRDCGGKVLLGDSPGVGSARKVAADCGILPELEAVGGEVVEFTVPENEGKGKDTGRLGDLDMACELSEADVIINLPKAKTHVFATLTLAVKNCFGCIVGLRKMQWHYRAGHNADLFARMLVDVYQLTGAHLHILDGIIGMDGNGPTSGTPKEMNLLAASTDGMALDAVFTRLVGLDIDAIPTLRVAREMADGEPPWLNPILTGTPFNELEIKGINFPRGRSFNNMIPAFLAPLMRRLVTARPVVRPGTCTGCATCARHCPAAVITMKNNLPVINHDGCIRCYCCHELCPEGAMDLYESLLSRMIAKYSPSQVSEQNAGAPTV